MQKFAERPPLSPHGSRAYETLGLSEAELIAFADLEPVETVGNRIKTARAAYGAARGKALTQAELASLMGLTKVTVSQWELGLYRPSRENMQKLADALECSTEWLQGAQNAAPPHYLGAIRTAPLGQIGRGGGLIVRGTAPTVGGDFVFTGQVDARLRRPPGLTRAQNAYAIRVRGHTMAPLFEDGTEVYIDPDAPIQISDYVLIELDGPKDEAGRSPHLIRRLIFRTAEIIEVWQAHPDKREDIRATRIVSMQRVLTTRDLLTL